MGIPRKHNNDKKTLSGEERQTATGRGVRLKKATQGSSRESKTKERVLSAAASWGFPKIQKSGAIYNPQVFKRAKKKGEESGSRDGRWVSQRDLNKLKKTTTGRERT